MPNKATHARAVCPFFKGNSRQNILCLNSNILKFSLGLVNHRSLVFTYNMLKRLSFLYFENFETYPPFDHKNISSFTLDVPLSIS